MPTITSRHNPIVARIRAVARGETPDLMLLDGVHLVGDALAAGCRIREAAVAAAARERDGELAALVDRLGGRGVDVALVSSPVMEALSPVRSPSPIVALAERPAQDVDRLFRPRLRAPLVLIAVGVQDPGNVGAIVRVAEAAGASGVMAVDRSADPFGWKALRGAMGSAFRLPVAARPTAREAIADARRRGCRVIATTPRAGRSLFDVDLTGASAILIGGEGAGLADDLLVEADERVNVPMEPPVESLNAAVTAAVIAYEARRQQSAGRPTMRRSQDRPPRT